MKVFLNELAHSTCQHRGVLKPAKATPLRIVFDASQKSRWFPSFNDCISEGLTFMNKIHEILIAAKWGKIMITADIQASFVQIRIPEEHKDLTRFLWVKDTEKPLDRSNIQIFRFTRVPFGINASPSILNMTISKRMMDIGTPLAMEILNKPYVDCSGFPLPFLFS
uniref:Reverse transcriptase domain-containing protein n=1 Tax=Heterorhabditis bacteriophora TaxID=37862 RepID=A0A1I7WGW0_HETBA